jgi:hypothetical protein
MWLKRKVESEKRILTSADVVYPPGTGGQPLFVPELQALDAILKDKKILQALEAAGWTTKNVDDLTKMGEMLAVLERGAVQTVDVGGKATIIDPVNKALKARIILASIYGIVKGRGIFAISDFLMKSVGYNPRKAAYDILEKSMTDPELAKILLMSESPQSMKMFKTYLANNFGNLQEVLTEEKFDYKIEKISPKEDKDITQTYGPSVSGPHPRTFTPPVIPGANAESRLARTNIVPPLDTGMMPVATAGGGGGIDPNLYARGQQLFGGRDEITFANQGGIMSTNKAFQRVA